MTRITAGAVAVAALSLAGVIGLAFRCEQLAARLRQLEAAPPPAAGPADPASTRTISDLQKSMTKLQSELTEAKLKAAAEAGHPVNELPRPADPGRVPMDRTKAQIVDRMKSSAIKFLEKEGPAIGLSSEQQERVLGILYEQITEIAKLNPKDGKERLEVEMNRINENAMAKATQALPNEQFTRLAAGMKAWFGGMMTPKPPANPPAGEKPELDGPRVAPDPGSGSKPGAGGR